MSFFLGEDLVGFCGGNCKRTLDVLQFRLLDKGRMRNVADVDLSGLWQQVTNHVFGTETVTHRTDLLTVMLGTHRHEARVNDRVDSWREMGDLLLRVLALHPLLDVEVAWTVQRDGVAVKEVGHHNEVAVCGELVCNELGVDRFVPDHVGDEQDAVFGRLVFRVRVVDFNVAEGFK